MLSNRRSERACINNITFMCLSGDVDRTSPPLLPSSQK
ncbi:hypothetical protein LZI70_15785 [Vibrio pelagius]|uniref:Uncharacterized protein n=1 Tax=Vibrio pelagius TaxID=28169 RepID=A0ABY5GCE2_VIBPE|nr:hypothetical protein [Vibrio pelagius]UTT87060.1 hypothetical protein LZI70_15785 [Vibrio pelagius]